MYTVYVYTYMCLYVYICIERERYTHTHTHMHVYIYIYRERERCTRTYIHTYIHTYLFMYYVYIYIYIEIYRERERIPCIRPPGAFRNACSRQLQAPEGRIQKHTPNPHHEILVFPDPTLGNPWKILAHPSKYLSNICFWATQPLAKIL